MSDASRIVLVYGDAPVTPASGKVEFYAKDDRYVYYKGDDGVERLVTASGTFVTTTLLELLDTPNAYDDGKFLKSAVSGTIWSTISGSDHSILSNLDYASAGHTGFASTAVLTSTSGVLQVGIDTNVSAISGNTILIATTSGSLQTQITDNSTHSAGDGSDHADVAQNTADIATVSGSIITDHSELDELDYASAGHTGFQPAGDYATNEDLTNVSGTVDTNTSAITTLDTKIDTTSGTLQAELDALDYYTTSEVDTISGSLSDEIDSDISIHAALTDAHHTESHTIVSHDTDATGAELDTLTDGSDADALHIHLTYLEATASGVLQEQIDDNTTHSTGDGSDHADVALNTTHRSSDGSDHSDVAQNTWDITIVSGTVDTNTSNIATNASDIVDNTTLIATTSGTLQTEIDNLDYYTTGEVDTISGSLSAEIDSDIVTFSGTIDHDTILNTHNLTTDIDHNQLTNYVVGEHRSINDGADGATDLWSASKISSEITTISGKLDDHDELNNLDYASAGHTGFQPTGDYLTDDEFSTYSGTLQTQIDEKSDTGHTHDDRYYTESEVDTISGSLSDEIDSDIITFSGTIDHDTILNTHNLTTDIDHDQLTNYSADEHRTIDDDATGATDLWSASKISSEITTTSGDIVSQIITDHGGLDGLGDDDHSIYHTDGRGDARYYTKTELGATTTGHTAGDDLIGVPSLAGATYTKLGDVVDLINSAGRISGGLITDEGGEKVTVASGTGFIKATDDDVAEIVSFNWTTATGIAIPNDSIRYIGVIYNSGTPIVDSRATNNYDLDTEFILGSVINEHDVLHVLTNPWWVSDGITNVIERFRAEGFFTRDNYIGGLILSVPGTRNVAVTAGTIWSHLNEFAISALDTTVTGTFETYWTDTSDNWTDNDVTQYPVTQWNDLTEDTLQNLGNNKYANWWVYLEVDDDEVAMVYPQAQFSTAAVAEAEAPPTIIPNHLSDHGILIGRILIKQGTDAPVEVQSVFTTTFTASAAADHGNLAGLTDDDHNQYHTDARGDARYYTETELDAGQLDNRYYTQGQTDTISGSLSAEIDSDISIHASDVDAHHNESHTVASHSDTSGTGAELNELTDGSETTLHNHAVIDAGGLSWSLISTNTTASGSNGYLINASGGNINLTLPSSPSEGDTVGVCDIYNKATTNVITVVRSGENIEGLAEDMVLNVNGAGFTLVYADATRGWEIVSEIGSEAGSGSLTLIGLTDTPGSYDDGKYLKATASGTEWATVSGGVFTHGDLSGLGDDDHTQYHTDARGDVRYYTQAEVDTISGSLQTNVDAKPDTLLELTDTPAAYEVGKYLKSTTSGTEWTTVSGAGGTSFHSELNELDYASAGHTGFTSTVDLSTTSGTLQTQIDDKSDGLNWTVVSGISENTIKTNGYLINASNNNVDLILPDNPDEGDIIGFCDFYNMATTNIITISGSDNIEGSSETLVVDIDGSGFELAYTDAVRGWEIISEIGSVFSGQHYTKSEIDTITDSLQSDIDNKDNYQSWSFAVDGVPKDPITTGDILDFVGGDNITVIRSAEDQITISGSAGTSDVQTFLDLDDTPSSYGTTSSGSAGNYLMATSSGIEYKEFYYYGTGDPPAANGLPDGVLYFKYTV